VYSGRVQKLHIEARGLLSHQGSPGAGSAQGRNGTERALDFPFKYSQDNYSQTLEEHLDYSKDINRTGVGPW
jgi:hypothetical protein